MVALLGGPADFVERMDHHLAAAPIVRDVVIEGEGVIAAIDTRAVGMAVVTLGGGRRLPTDSIDHRVGFDRLAALGTEVHGQTVIGRVFAADESMVFEAGTRLRAAFTIAETAQNHPLIADRIGAPLMPRAILCILDSFGIGGAPDAADYGDAGADTLGHIAANYRISLPNMDALGLGAAAQLSTGELPRGLTAAPKGGRWGVGREVSKGKDTPSGHWEIAGVPVPFDWGYFPQTEPTFPPELIAQLVEKSGIPGILGDRHASGTTIIAELGEESIRTGKPICYTSIDSVFQIAAHETHFGLERLYKLCETAFELTAPLNIGRVIARPFVGENPGTFKRTGNRRDFAIPPPEPTLLDRAKAGRPAGLRHRQDLRHLCRPRRHPQDQGLGQHGAVRPHPRGHGNGRRRRLHHGQLRRFRPGIRPPPRRPRLRPGARGAGPAAPRDHLAGYGPTTSSSSPPTTATTRPGAAPTTPASRCRSSAFPQPSPPEALASARPLRI